ncbi:hypothetical protein FDECE_10444 [Fusarium decemcellulare]|nr:hypothetical protein FDECE_10444 [Fusarium decemcellulare]
MSISQDTHILSLRDDAIQFGGYATTKFWGRVFNRHIFKGEQWNISTYQPPAPMSQMRINVLVERWGVSNQEASSYLLVIGANLGRATPGDIQEVESQAMKACIEHGQYTNRGTLWVMTCFGPEARLWAYRSDVPFLVPFYPWVINPQCSDGDCIARNLTSSYLDVCEYEAGFLHALRHIMQHPEPSPQLFESYNVELAASHQCPGAISSSISGPYSYTRGSVAVVNAPYRPQSRGQSVAPYGVPVYSNRHVYDPWGRMVKTSSLVHSTYGQNWQPAGLSSYGYGQYGTSGLRRSRTPALYLDPNEYTYAVVIGRRSGLLTITLPDGSICKTLAAGWTRGLVLYEGEPQECFTYASDDGEQFMAWSL